MTVVIIGGWNAIKQRAYVVVKSYLFCIRVKCASISCANLLKTIRITSRA